MCHLRCLNDVTVSTEPGVGGNHKKNGFEACLGYGERKRGSPFFLSSGSSFSLTHFGEQVRLRGMLLFYSRIPQVFLGFLKLDSMCFSYCHNWLIFKMVQFWKFVDWFLTALLRN